MLILRLLDEGLAVQITFFDRAGNLFGGISWQFELQSVGLDEFLGRVHGQVQEATALLFGVGWQGAGDFIF
jgi:hypothetical protein